MIYRTPNARTRFYELFHESMETDGELTSTILHELLSFLDCDTITEFIDHLRQTGYITDDEDSDSDAEEDDSIDTESYEMVI